MRTRRCAVNESIEFSEFNEWRGFDLTARCAKIARAFDRAEVSSPEDLPILVNTPCYFAFATRDKPEDYFTNPATMVEVQARGYEKHLAAVNDDVVPYFMPWFGTGVLASAFGCEITIASGPGNDPAVAGPCVTSPADAARLKMPDPYEDGWMPRVLDAIDHARANYDLPVGLTDMQGPLDTLGLMCGQAQLYEWMYREPRMIHELSNLVTEAFIEWVKVQKAHIGEPLDRSNGLQGVGASPIGVWESDDDMVLLDPALYEAFVVPYVSRIFQAFGGGSVHFCGNGYHHLDNLRKIEGLRVVNTSPMGNFQAFAEFRKQLDASVVVQVQDIAPIDVEGYYRRLFAELDDFRGLMIAPFAVDTIGMDEEGGSLPVDWEPFETANRIVAVTRECLRRKLAGEPILTPQPGTEVFPAAKPTAADEGERLAFSTGQEATLKGVRERLIDFDRTGLESAVHAALDAGLAPMQIVTFGLAEGMNAVGRLYEAGEFYLPQLVMAGATMREGLGVLKPLLGEASGQREGKGTIVFGTVQGDMHDIGKNIVKTMLEAAGFTVHDLGIDKPAASFVDKARETCANILAMSALLTTTMPSMVEVIDALEEAGLRDQIRVLVGGAPVSREFANQIGAEGYASDAVKAVREAERLMAL